MNGSKIFLAILASLFVLSTISYASWVCVEKPPNTKSYAIFETRGTFKTVPCAYRAGTGLCCADINLSDTLKVSFTLLDDRVVELLYRVLASEMNGVTLVKVYDKYDAFITVWGPPGTYIVTEEIPKDSVESAWDLEGEFFVIETDPLIAWFVELNGGPAVVSYTVKRGSVPDVLPTVSLASCDLEVKKVSGGVVFREGKPHLLYTFEVLYDGKRIIPPPSRVKVLVDGKFHNFSVEPAEKLLSVYVPLPEDKTRASLLIEVSAGGCRAKLSDTVNVVREAPNLFFLLAGVLLGGLLVYLFLRPQRG